MITRLVETLILFGNDILGSLLTVYSYTHDFFINHKYIGIFVIAFLVLTLIIYILLYRLLKIEKNVFSYISFTLFITIVISYILGYKYVLNLEYPVYIHDLSILSYYKYIIFTVCGSIAIIYWIIKLFNPSRTFTFKISFYINIKEEIRKILYIWNDGFMGDICCYLYGKIATSHKFSSIYFSIHFFLFYIIRCISLGLLINFVFFNGNLYAFAHTIPVIFFVWLLRFFDYYFIVFREGTSNYLTEILLVSYRGKFEKSDVHYNLLECDIKDLSFVLSPIAEKEGFTTVDLDFLKSKWFTCAEVTRKFMLYDRIVEKLSITLIGGLYICWVAISIHFFNHKGSDVHMEWFLVFRRFPTRPIHGNFCRLPREARFVREGKPMNDVKVATLGAVSPGHPVVGEVETTGFRVDAGLTHGNPPGSIPLNSTGIPPDKDPVFIVPVPSGPVIIPLHLLHNSPIPHSTPFFEQPFIKTILDDLNKK